MKIQVTCEVIATFDSEEASSEFETKLAAAAKEAGGKDVEVNELNAEELEDEEDE